MPAATVLLVERRDTKYSINALLAALDSAGVEARVYSDPWGALADAKMLAERGRRVVLGVSLMTEHVAEGLEELRRLAAEASRVPRLLLVAGGPHPTGDPVGTLRLGFHVVVVGEGEGTLPLLAEAWGEEGWDGVTRVRGILYLEDGRPVFTGRREPIWLDEYWSFPWWRRRFSPIEITRGCWWGCRYCETWFIHGARERHRSIESIVEHVKAMAEAGLRDVRFITPNALGYGAEGRRRRLDLLEEMVLAVKRVSPRLRVFIGSFPSEVRPEYVDDEAARLIARHAANKRVIVGAQSGSERILRMINRGHTVDDVLNAVETLRRHGLRPEVDFIFGLPGETREDQEATLKVMRRIVELGGRVHAHTFMPLPGTPLESAPGGRIPGWLRREITRLIGIGGLYGQWEKQERLAARIHELYEKGVILGLRGWREARLRRGSV